MYLSVSTAVLSSTPTSKSKNGSFKVGNKTVTYGATLTATETKSTLTTSAGMNLTLNAEVIANVKVDPFLFTQTKALM